MIWRQEIYTRSFLIKSSENVLSEYRKIDIPLTIENQDEDTRLVVNSVDFARQERFGMLLLKI